MGCVLQVVMSESFVEECALSVLFKGRGEQHGRWDENTRLMMMNLCCSEKHDKTNRLDSDWGEDKQSIERVYNICLGKKVFPFKSEPGRVQRWTLPPHVLDAISCSEI